MGNLFGFLHASEKTPDGPYGSPGDGYIAKSTVTFYIPPDVSANRAVLIERGIRKWQKVLSDPRIGITLYFHRDATAPRDVTIAFSATKPRDNTDRERWATTVMNGLEPGTPWDYASGTITFWTGIGNGDLEETATHEAGHVWGLTRHSEGGLMDEGIKSGNVHKHDETTLLNAYLRTDRPRKDRMRA